MSRLKCDDRAARSILKSWRYDLSQVHPGMRHDLDRHLAECPACAAQRRLHRGVDLALAVLGASGFGAAVAALAWTALRGLLAGGPHGVLPALRARPWVSAEEVGALALSALLLLVVVTATPIPSYLGERVARRFKGLEAGIPMALKTLFLR